MRKAKNSIPVVLYDFFQDIDSITLSDIILTMVYCNDKDTREPIKDRSKDTFQMLLSEFGLREKDWENYLTDCDGHSGFFLKADTSIHSIIEGIQFHLLSLAFIRSMDSLNGTD